MPSTIALSSPSLEELVAGEGFTSSLSSLYFVMRRRSLSFPCTRSCPWPSSGAVPLVAGALPDSPPSLNIDPVHQVLPMAFPLLFLFLAHNVDPASSLARPTRPLLVLAVVEACAPSLTS
jgi:hypothetical protein